MTNLKKWQPVLGIGGRDEKKAELNPIEKYAPQIVREINQWNYILMENLELKGTYFSDGHYLIDQRPKQQNDDLQHSKS